MILKYDDNSSCSCEGLQFAQLPLAKSILVAISIIPQYISLSLLPNATLFIQNSTKGKKVLEDQYMKS